MHLQTEAVGHLLRRKWVNMIMPVCKGGDVLPYAQGSKCLSGETFSDVRIPSGYHNREPLDWSLLALRYVLLRQHPGP